MKELSKALRFDHRRFFLRLIFRTSRVFNCLQINMRIVLDFENIEWDIAEAVIDLSDDSRDYILECRAKCEDIILDLEWQGEPIAFPCESISLVH